MIEKVILGKSIQEKANLKRQKTKSTRGKITFMANVFFGSPRNKCSGHGICKLTEVGDDGGLNNWSPCRTLALVTADERMIRIQVLKSSISRALKRRQFSDHMFQVDDDFDFSPFLPGVSKRVIKRGFYTFFENENFIEIIFY